ncbi:CheR family methyltransferase [Mycolicibacterium brisbanense]
MEPTDESFDALLRYMRDSRGFDFTGYKRTSLVRRVRHRMDHAGYDTFDQYLDVLQASSEEFSALFNTILINVSSFFRDPDAWDFVRTDVIPRLLAERGPDDPVRVWSAGCASGQEAYTLAILLAEALGPEAFRQRVKIYATDIDEGALTQARAASYDQKSVESVPPDLLSRYFEQLNGRYIFHKDLHRAVIFGRNDLVKDVPISRVDLLVCRNTLMYLNAEAQRNVLGRLHFALTAQGALFLGHAEMLLSHADGFTPLNLKHRVFRKAAGSHTGLERYDPAASMYDRHGDPPGLTTVRELAFRASPVAQLAVTGEDTVAMINQQAESIFGLSEDDIGRLLRDLEVSYRPVELRAYIEQAKVELRSARIPDVKWQRPGAETVWFEIHVNPLVDAENGLLGVSIVFFDVTATRALVDKVVQTNRQLEAAYEELQSTNEELQSTVEALQSTNDELDTINDTLRERSSELDHARTFLDSLVNSVHLGMVVVDREMRVVVWNRHCEDLWGLRSDETTDTVFTSLDMGLPLERIRPLIANAFVDSGQAGEVTVDAVNRRGRHTRIRVSCTAFRFAEGGVKGALLLMEELA